MTREGADDDRDKWDRKYTAMSADAKRSLSPFFTSVLPDLPTEGVALDLACGLGRHAIALAEHGLDVTGLDVSPIGLATCEERARAVGTSLATAVMDLESWEPETGIADVICVVSYHFDDLAARIRRALRPGGHVIYASFSLDQLRFEGGPRNPEWLVKPGALLEAFAGFHIRRYEERADMERDPPRARARLHASAP